MASDKITTVNVIFVDLFILAEFDLDVWISF